MISRWAGALALVCTALVQPAGLAAGDPTTAAREDAQGKGKPKAALRVNPSMIAFPPARIVATAELTEGADDYQDYYCPKIEWLWGDGAQSESAEDCDPYVAGKSEIRRRYSADHTFRNLPMGGAAGYDVVFRMKQGSKVVLSIKQTVRIR